MSEKSGPKELSTPVSPKSPTYEACDKMLQSYYQLNHRVAIRRPQSFGMGFAPGVFTPRARTNSMGSEAASDASTATPDEDTFAHYSISKMWE